MKDVKIYLEDLSCPDCANKIESILNDTKGVKSATVHFSTGKANVKYDKDVVSLDKLKEEISKTGYQVLKTR